MNATNTGTIVLFTSSELAVGYPRALTYPLLFVDHQDAVNFIDERIADDYSGLMEFLPLDPLDVLSRTIKLAGSGKIVVAYTTQTLHTVYNKEII